MDRRKQMEGTGDARDRYDDELPESHEEATPSEQVERMQSGDYESHGLTDDTVPGGNRDGWQRTVNLQQPELPPDPPETARPRRATIRASHGLPVSIPAAQPGLLSGWAERSIQRPEEDDYGSDLPGDAGTDVEGGLDSNQLDEWAESQGDTLLTKMDMDWDEDEALTTLRDQSTILPPPEDANAERGADDEYARVQNIVPFRAPSGLNAPIFSGVGATGGGSQMLSTFGAPKASATGRGLWYGAAAAVGVMLAFVARAVLGPPAPSTAIIVTKPADATVLVDGRALPGPLSPFTVQGLEPDVDHRIEVRKDGFTSRTLPLRLTEGEVKTLPEIELASAPVRSGFALTSVPPGATVLIDGTKLSQVTPVRVEDSAPGPRSLQVTLDGYQPWQTVVFVVAGQVIELPPAELVRAPARRLTWAERVAARRAAAAAERAERAAAAPASRARSAQPEEPVDDDGEAQSKVRKRLWTGAEAEARLRRGARAGEAEMESDDFEAETDGAESSKESEAVEAAPARRRAEPEAPVASTTGTGAEKGALSVNSRPWSQVTIDGKLIGNTPQLSVPLVAGRHKVKLSNPELGIVRGFTVDIVAGETTTKTIEFGE